MNILRCVLLLATLLAGCDKVPGNIQAKQPIAPTNKTTADSGNRLPPVMHCAPEIAANAPLAAQKSATVVAACEPPATADKHS